MQFLKITTFFLFIAFFLVIVQILLFYARVQHDYIFNCQDKRDDRKTTDKRQEDIKPMSYARNTYTIIRQEDNEARQKRMIFPRFTLYDVEPDWRKKAVVLIEPVEHTQRYMTIGIVTAKRPNSITYLYNTLDSLLQNAVKHKLPKRESNVL